MECGGDQLLRVARSVGPFLARASPLVLQRKRLPSSATLDLHSIDR